MCVFLCSAPPPLQPPRRRDPPALNLSLASASPVPEMERVLKDDAIQEKGERARMASFVGAMAIADLVKTTLGPKGM
uniref:Uncharacterized protein n=1 Tax=Aegilops tauschii subsp. strangulata TaxID=200361 RepID=A0A453IPQ5_AEGTS